MLEKVKRSKAKAHVDETANVDEEPIVDPTEDLAPSKFKARMITGVAPLNRAAATLYAISNAPYVQNKMQRRAFEEMRAKMELGSVGKSKGRKRVPRKFEDEHLEAIHISEEGWYGIPATSFRAAMIDACRLVGFHMTKAKMSIFVVADGLDRDDNQPLVKIYGQPRALEMPVRLKSGVTNIAVRPQWRTWKAAVQFAWDADQFSDQDVMNLFSRAGHQVGIGAGRNFSKESVGMGWGSWYPGSKEEFDGA